LPAVTDAADGDKTRWSSGPTTTVREAVLVLPPSLPVTVCAPRAVAVHVLPVQEPLGAIEKVVAAVTSPRELPAASKPCAVYAWAAPAAMVALAGLITMWSSVVPVTMDASSA